VRSLQGLRVVCVAAITVSLLLPLLSAIGLTGIPVIGSLLSATWLGFDALFVLSGLLVARGGPTFTGPGDLLRWWGRRLLRIYPMYAVSLVLLLVVSLTLLAASWDTGAVLRAVVLIGAVESSFAAPLWGVSVLWLAILLMPLVMMGITALRHLPGVLAGLGVVLGAVAMVVMTTSIAAPTFGVGAYVRGLADIALGAILWTVLDTALSHASLSRVRRLGNALALFGMLALIVGVAAGLAPGWMLPAVAAVVAGAALGDRNINALFIALDRWGDASYATFAAAAVVCATAVGLTADWANSLGITLVGLAALALIAGLGGVLWRLVDRPIQDRLGSPLRPA